MKTMMKQYLKKYPITSVMLLGSLLVLPFFIWNSKHPILIFLLFNLWVFLTGSFNELLINRSISSRKGRNKAKIFFTLMQIIINTIVLILLMFFLGM